VKKLIVATAVAASALFASVATTLAVNDPFVPGETCASPNAQAVGHPAFLHEQSDVAGAPFSANNPGASTGARGSEHSQAPCDT
jgi:hypothetical protein